MNVVDSTGWLEYLSDGPAAAFFAPAIERPSTLVVPTLSLFEVFKRVRQQRDESAALTAVALMRQGQVVELTESLAVSAANVSIQHRLPMADSIMYATARAHEATLWTLDVDFAHLPDVQYRKR